MRHLLFSFLLSQLGLMSTSFSYADGYELGQGWRAGNYYSSGYTNIEVVDRFGSPAKLQLDDLSWFVGGHFNRQLNPLLEVELSGYTLIRQGGGGTGGDAIVERLYNHATLTEQDTLQLGKMLTPLGNWNAIHAAPLLPIITRPYSIGRGFNSYLSGIAWTHDASDGGIPDFQLYWQPDNELFKRPVTQTIRNFHNVVGGQITNSFDAKSKMGMSFQQGTLIESGERYTLLGINACRSFGKLRMESEAITARFSGTVLAGTPPRIHADESGIFVLADYALTAQWHGIVAGEYYQDHTMHPSSRSTILAINYKPTSVPVVWKLEYIHQAGVTSPIAPIVTGLKGAFTLFL
jgi:hypothetical protein